MASTVCLDCRVLEWASESLYVFAQEAKALKEATKRLGKKKKVNRHMLTMHCGAFILFNTCDMLAVHQQVQRRIM